MSALERQLDVFLKRTPRIRRGVFIARGAVVVGDVILGEHSSVWYNAVLRGDINRIEVGHHTNIQDNAVLHLADDYPCRVGNYVTVGHSAVIHACTIRDDVLVGMGAIILDGAVISRQCLIGAGALVPQRAQIPEGSLVLGSPARVVRRLTGPEKKALRQAALKYAANAEYHLNHRINVQRLPTLAAIPSRSSR